jgi:hypothetical protein
MNCDVVITDVGIEELRKEGKLDLGGVVIFYAPYLTEEDAEQMEKDGRAIWRTDPDED